MNMVKYLKGEVGSQEKRLLNVVYKRVDTLRIAFLEPKDPLPASFSNWREN